MSMINPLAKARGRGSAKEGTHHWGQQRLTALLLIPLTAWLIWAVLSLTGADYANARAFVAHPVNALLGILLLLSLAHHLKLGLQVVVEDYVHTPWLEIGLQLLIKLFALLAAAGGVLAILYVTLGG